MIVEYKARYITDECGKLQKNPKPLRQFSTLPFSPFTGKGTADDFLKLMDIVGKKVKDQFGIVLELEIRILGR
jgi:hypothetical protein